MTVYSHYSGRLIPDICAGNVTKYYELPLWKIMLIFMSLFCPPLMFFFIADGYRYTRGSKGKYPAFAKWFFCCFYPLHYIVIWAVRRIVNH